jgi:subtilisin-like proprotein convertase family protein
MKVRSRILILLCLLSLATAWFFWPRGGDASSPSQFPAHAQQAAAPATSVPVPSVIAAASAVSNAVANAVVTRSAASTNREFFRLSNTTKTLGELTTAPRAILLENALVDTGAKLELNIPKHLRAAGEPGAFIVQARGQVDAAFRAALANAGGQIVSYIPNNAYLVQLSGAGAGVLAGNPLVQAVLPYEPYFKVQASLLDLAVNQKPLPPGKVLTLGLFADGAEATLAQIRKLGGQILGTDRSPFGPVVRVLPLPTENWLALAQLPGVQRVEPATHRQLANDLARVTMGISTDTVTNANWLGLTGLNVVVEVNDTGIDAGHPDFTLTGTAATGPSGPSRVTGKFASSLVDVDGHGTHVAGIIAGNGAESYSLTNAPSGSVTNADMRGKAPAAKLYAFGFLGANDTNIFVSDEVLQSIPALTNALISNNSWVNSGANEYDLSAASYDAAVRDALPYQTGPQPVLFVFAAGNDGNGFDNGGGGDADSILSPGTAKNVITVGALDQLRNITNTYTPLNSTNEVAAWLGETSSPNLLAAYSARGNVGVQTEGDHGRFKPDVVAPGTFVVSTRSTTWDMAAYYNPTNYDDQYSEFGLIVAPNQVVHGGGSVPINGVGLTIRVVPNRLSPDPFPTNMPIYFSATGLAGVTNNDFATSNNVLSIPPGGGSITSISPLLNNGFSVAIGNPTNVPINFDLFIRIATTNDNGNYLTVLSNLNETIGPWYVYDTGTSMAAPAVSGALALMQDFFTNILHATPSPALLKAMLINGARLTPGYSFFAVTNNINYEGWGLVNVPNSIPLALTNAPGGGSNTVPMFFVDQSPTNVLATGDSRTYLVSVPTEDAQAEKLRITLAWTDPPGNPAAGIKLVNNLDLVVTNLDTGAVYYGNTFIATTSVEVDTNSVGDAVNNVENIWLPAPLGTNYAVTVVGRNVTVNAVTAEQTNIVQDYALVISCGDAMNTNGIIVTAATPSLASATTPRVTYVFGNTNGIYFNQLAGANAPWLSTNAVPFGAGSAFGTNASLYIGQTNQWHFYVVQNTTTFTNAAFIVFLPNTLSIPRMGGYTFSEANSTRPEADLDLFVASEASLTNLDWVVISNCVYGRNGDQASLSRGGTEFVVYSNSTPGQFYYVGIHCEDQLAAEYGFLPIFSESPFSTLNPDGSQTVNGLLLPAAIPDGTPAHGGVGYVFGLAIYPMEVGGLTVTNTITHENYGDLIGVLSHGSKFATLNNHDSPNTSVVNLTTIYNDDGQPGTVGTDGPGSLRNFTGEESIGPWLLTEVDDSFTQTGAITGFTINIQPHKDLTKQPFTTVSILPGTWFYGYVDVPVGYTNITVVATNLPTVSTPPIELYLNYNVEPTFTNYLGRALLTNGTPNPGNSISYGPPMQPGRYWVGLFNPDVISHDVLVGVYLSFNASAISTVNYGGSGPLDLKDDAVNYDFISVTNRDLIQGLNVGLRVDHPRISDLVFTLISPDDTRYLLMENRGGQSTNGCGVTVVTTNIVNVSANGGPQANTNYINIGLTSGTFPITYNFYTAPDQMTVYYGTNVVPANLIYDTGLTNNPSVGGGGAQNTAPVTITVSFPPVGVPANSTYLTIVMNQFGNPNSQTAWTYTAGGVLTNNYYLTLTENTNLTTTPIKYATPPLVPAATTTAVVVTNITPAWHSSFEGGVGNATLFAVTNFAEGWQVFSGSVDWLTNGIFGSTAYDGGYFIDLNGNDAGSISTNVPTTNGGNYTLTFAYAKNPDAGSPPSAQLSIGGNPVGVVTPATLNAWTNLQWATTSVVFTASSALTSIQFASQTGGSSGVLLDAMDLQLTAVATNVVTTTGDLYYQPEQSLKDLLGTSAFGLWQLEILDNRAGATNHAVLQSWQLQFTFANTNYTLPILNATNSGPFTLPGGATQWFLVQTPTNADFATNTLLFSTLPLNMWWSTNVPPTRTNATDFLLLSNSLAGSSVFGTNPPAPFFTPGGTYYLGFYNPNATAATYDREVTFHLLAVAPSVITRPATNVTFTSATLQALVNPNLSDTTVYFEYGTDTNYTLGPSTSIVLTTNLNLPQAVGIDVTNLTPNTLYHFRAVAANGFGTNYGLDLIFISTPLPYSASVPATLLNGASAQLNGFASPNGAQAYAWFEWGTSTTYGIQTPVVDVGSNSTVVFVTNQISGLITNLPYHFRLVVSNSVGVAYGFDQIFNQGNVVAWGANYVGQAAVPGGLTNLVVGVAAGYENSLALNNDGSVVVWGINTFGQTNVPVSVTNAVGIGGGDRQSLALRSDRTVRVWGSNQFGQTNVPANLTNAVGAASGGIHCLALRANGIIAAWGFNGSGQTSIPGGLTNVVAISGGELHSLALRNNGTVAAWGYNGDGETDVPTNLNHVVAIAAGGYHNLALKSDGTVVAWGDNQDHQTDVPGGLTNVIAIAAGGFHSLALKSDGTVVGWGDNGSLQITMPTNLNNVVAIAGGGLHSLALTSLFGLNQTNNAPFWLTNPPALTMNALTTLIVTNTAKDTNFPTQTLLYSLLNAPPWASINPQGLISLSPPFTNSPSTNIITTKVTDNGYPALSATNSFTVVVLPPINLTNGVTQTNSVIGGGVNYYLVNVPTNADFATNRLLSATPGVVNVWFSTNAPPSVGSLGDFELLTNVTVGSAVVNTNTAPLLVPGAFYWLGVQNTNSFTVTYSLKVDFHFISATNPPVSISSIIYTTNSLGSNGFLLTWFAPTNALFKVEFTDTLVPANWIAFTNIISYNTNAPGLPPNAQFNFFDDGLQYPFGPTRFYRLILLSAAANTLTLPAQSNLVVAAGTLVTVTNTATNSNPAAMVTYSLVSSPAGATITTNGIITWTNASPAGLAAQFTTLATDDGSPIASATNTFTVFVSPFPTITNVVVTATNTTLSWLAPSNDVFQVQWTTNLAPPVWLPFPGTITSTNSVFTFVDTNAPLLMKFYQLILLP